MGGLFPVLELLKKDLKGFLTTPWPELTSQTGSGESRPCKGKIDVLAGGLRLNPHPLRKDPALGNY
jgi:hypothetical protein